MYFVYVENNDIASPQKWAQDAVSSATGKGYPTLKKIKITYDEYQMSLNELMQKYPLNKE